MLCAKLLLKKAYSAWDGARELFVNLLKIRDANSIDVLNELTGFRGMYSMPGSLDKLRSYYDALDKLATQENRVQIR